MDPNQTKQVHLLIWNFRSLSLASSFFFNTSFAFLYFRFHYLTGPITCNFFSTTLFTQYHYRKLQCDYWSHTPVWCSQSFSTAKKKKKKRRKKKQQSICLTNKNLIILKKNKQHTLTHLHTTNSNSISQPKPNGLFEKISTPGHQQQYHTPRQKYTVNWHHVCLLVSLLVA